MLGLEKPLRSMKSFNSLSNQIHVPKVFRVNDCIIDAQSGQQNPVKHTAVKNYIKYNQFDESRKRTFGKTVTNLKPITNKI